MEFTETSTIDSITVKDSGHIEVRRSNKVFKGSVEISKAYHRHVLSPGDSLEEEDPKVASIAKVVWKL